MKPMLDTILLGRGALSQRPASSEGGEVPQVWGFSQYVHYHEVIPSSERRHDGDSHGMCNSAHEVRHMIMPLSGVVVNRLWNVSHHETTA